MPTIFIYNNESNHMERYERNWNEPMPYNMGGTLTVGEFRGSSCSHLLWSDVNTMEAWNTTRAAFGRPIPVGYAFKRIWEGGHAGQSQHYAGTAFDVGQRLSNASRNLLRNLAAQLGVWGYVEPAHLTPTWVHFDRRFPNPACASGGYPRVFWGRRNTYVLVLQDALSALGFSTGGLDGIFGANTLAAVLRFQRSSGLIVDGIVGCNTWRALTSRAMGIGQTPTVEWKCNYTGSIVTSLPERTAVSRHNCMSISHCEP